MDGARKKLPRLHASLSKLPHDCVFLTAGKMATTSAQDATVLALTPLCVVKAEQQPDQLVLLKKESSWSRGSFVEKAG